MGQVVQIEPLGRGSVPVTIPHTSSGGGDYLSVAIDLGGFEAVAIQMPSSWDTAAITFQAAEKFDGTYENVYLSGGSELSVTAAASHTVILNAAIGGGAGLAGLRYIKLRSGTGASPVQQAADRLLNILVRQGGGA